MAGIPSGEGSGDARGRSIPVSELFTPSLLLLPSFSAKYDLDLLGEMWSGLSHLPFDEGLEALGKVRSVAFPVAILLQSFELSHEPYCRAFYNP